MADGGQITRFKLDSNEILLYKLTTMCTELEPYETHQYRRI